ncbi:hypothetical protein [endosymbiont of Ridgeia piscesae]|uniref:Uncharacterized protein n=1 Tax=endosymbiont of Ridgeia piscesae TaxID=54398 RepID=A0A0T5Z4W9_9GAMM|nr:hypothetical protein [endosymbiont of Ridgeia piscesae]KRT57534.1 hypothetical protein Ga0076813_11705 [endosymbiont of Ridgeia piscesae]
MVTPIHPDKSVTNPSNRQIESNRNRTAGEARHAAAASDASQPSRPDTQVDVEKARQLYEMEQSRAEQTSPRIETPQQARSTLEQILAQLKATPQQAQQALQAQGGVSEQLGNLLESAPA